MKREYQEFTGKTVEEAVRDGLRELGLKEEEADIRVLEEGKKKLFGYVKARVEIAPKGGDEEAEASAEAEEEKEPEERQTAVHCDAKGRTDGERAVEFLEGLFDILKITASTELRREEEKIEINVTAANTNAVIGKRGAMLDAIQTIAGAVANTGRDEYKRVVVDCENYRENRELTLQNLANKLAEKAIRFEKKLKLEPMNPYERRIIHAALSGREDVTTQSEGKEPYRYIVIVPGLAIPHSTKGSPGVQKTSIAFAKFETPVRFDENDLDKDAALFFTLAAVDEEEHLKNMRQLFLILSDEELLEKLAQANTAEELLELDQLLS